MDDRYWFAPKHFGYGAGLPLRWQGWAFYAALMAGLVLATRFDGTMCWMTIAVILSFALPMAAQRTQGGWKWRWGSPS